MKRVLDPSLSLEKQILLLLASATGKTAVSELARWTDSTNDTRYLLRRLRQLHQQRKLELASDEKTVLILPPGSAEVEHVGAHRAAGVQRHPLANAAVGRFAPRASASAHRRGTPQEFPPGTYPQEVPGSGIGGAPSCDRRESFTPTVDSRSELILRAGRTTESTGTSLRSHSRPPRNAAHGQQRSRVAVLLQ